MFGRAGDRPATPAAACPLPGIPRELQDGVDKLLADEPDHPEPTAASATRWPARRRRTEPARLIFEHWRLAILAAVLVAIVSVVNQAGPAPDQHRHQPRVGGPQEHGRHHRGVGPVPRGDGHHRDRPALQVAVTGRLAAWVMNDLRVKVFTHLQRMSLDFYTDEKAGVIMTRMTSDIENLQQLLQDGLASSRSRA